MLTVASIVENDSGSKPKPGEISLAHHGVLFLDELPEFSRHVLEVLRQPLETGEIHLARASHERRYPASFQLVAAMNPCPCGHLGDPRTRCQCSQSQIQRYQARLSGPLLDRIDLQVEVPALPPEQLTAQTRGESSFEVRQRVLAARQRQQARGALNSRLSGEALELACALDAEERAWLAGVLEKLRLSARAYHRVLRVALTLADLEGAPKPVKAHFIEAIGYRQLDRLLKGG